MSVSLFGAWHLWWSGKSLTGTTLWGLNIIWWGRIGKLLEFLAAYGVIVEIAGPERLRKYGESLTHLVPKDKIVRVFNSTRKWAWAMMRYAFSKSGSEKEKLALAETSTFGFVDTFNVFFSIVPAVVSALIIVIVHHWKLWVFPPFATFACVLVFGYFAFWILIGGPALILLFLGVVNVLGAVADAVFFRGTAKILEYKELDTAVKVGALVILAIGFQFDLLTA
jgi:hypothetical protein